MKRLLIFAGTAVMLLVAGGFAAAGPQPPLYFAAESEVSAEDIEDGAVTTSKIADGAVTTSKLHAESLVNIARPGAFSKLGVETVSPEFDIGFGGDDDRDIGINQPSSASHGGGLTITGGRSGAGTNLGGGNVVLKGGVSTGNQSTRGAIIMHTPNVGGSGSSDNSVVERMRIAAGGNVGIGDSTPTEGKLVIAAPSTAIPAIDVNGAANSNTVKIKGAATTGQSYGMAIDAGTNSTDTGLLVRDQTGASTYLRVRGDGNVGIGTASPATHLHIADSTATSAKLTIGDTDSAACIMLRDTDAAGWTECNALNGTLSCTTDADGVCDGS